MFITCRRLALLWEIKKAEWEARPPVEDVPSGSRLFWGVFLVFMAVAGLSAAIETISPSAMKSLGLAGPLALLAVRAALLLIGGIKIFSFFDDLYYEPLSPEERARVEERLGALREALGRRAALLRVSYER